MEAILTILYFVCNWRIYQKMGRQGWEGIIPVYNAYVLFQEVYGNGWRMLLMLIPLYNIYLVFELYIKLAKKFNQGAGFGVGLVFLYPIFALLLAFGKAVYGDGTQQANGDDPISETIDTAAEFVSNAFSGKKKDPEALNKLEQLKRMRDDGVLSDEEYEKMKKDIMDRI